MLHCVTAFTCFCTFLCHPYILAIFVENFYYFYNYSFGYSLAIAASVLPNEYCRRVMLRSYMNLFVSVMNVFLLVLYWHDIPLMKRRVYSLF